MVIDRSSIPAFSTIEVEIHGCDSITFMQGCISDLRNLRVIHLNGIGSIEFQQESMNWYGYQERTLNEVEERFDITRPSLKISIYNSNISVISSHTFVGRINEILFDEVIIENIQPIAFSNLLQTEKIIFKNTVVKRIDVQALKKFSAESIELDGVTAATLPSRTFSNITVYQHFTITDCNFGSVFSGSFAINNPKVFQVTRTNITTLYGEAFKIVSRGSVIFRNNTFGVVNDGAFQGIILKKDEILNDVLFIFDSNTFSSLSRYSLYIPDFSVKFVNIYINEPCDCQAIDHKIKESAYYDDIMCLYENGYLTLKNYKSHMCSVITNHHITIIIISIVATLLIVVVAGLILYYRFVYRRKKYGSKERMKNNGNLSLIVPDGRTYRETELHVILEKTDLLTTDL